MNTTVKKRILWGYRILLSLSLLLAGLCLAAQCLRIYRSGPHPFTPEAIAAAFSEIAGPVLFCGILVLLGLLLAPLFPRSGGKPEKNEELLLARLEATVDLGQCPTELLDAVMRLLLRRTVVRNLGWSVLALSSVIFLALGANPANFDSTEINGSMLKAMTWLAPCMALPFGYGVFAAYYRKASVRKEIALLKTAPPEAKCPPVPEEAKPQKAPWLRYGILAAALALLVGGYLMGGAVDVLTKAVNICTECIGLG